MAVRREPVLARVLQDGTRLLVVLAMSGSLLAVLRRLPDHFVGTFLVATQVATFFVVPLVVLAVLRELVPRPQAGAHRIGKNRDYVTWLLSSALAEVGLHALLRGPFWFFHFTRVLYLRALRSHVAWSAAIPYDLCLREPSLLTIGEGAQLEPGVTIEAGLHGAGRVRIGRVTVGKGVLVGAHAVLLPGATLGHDARVEPSAFVGEDVKVGVSAAVGEGARLEREVDLGSYTAVGTGAIVGEGVRVGDRARIAAGAVVEPGTVIGERELWAGVPARRMEADRATLPDFSEDPDDTEIVLGRRKRPRTSSVTL